MFNFRDLWGRIDDRLGREVDASTVGWVRLVVAASFLIQLGFAVYYQEIYDRYIDPAFFFKYPFFQLIRPMPGYVPYGVFTLIGLLGLALFCGWQTYWTAKVLTLLVIYVFLQDASMYSDHEYLQVLFLILLAWIPVNRWFSSDRLTGRESRSTVPYWALWILKFQVSLILICSGLNKFTSDWLIGAPIAEWLTVEGGNWGQLEFVRQSASFAPAIGWGTAIFETLAGILLWTRIGSLLFVPLLILYYGFDTYAVGMGVSPLLGFLSVVFLSPSFPRRFFDRIIIPLSTLPIGKQVWRLMCGLGRIANNTLAWFDETPVVGRKTIVPVADTGSGRRDQDLWLVSEWTKYGLAIWMLIQLILPIRWIGYNKAKDWAEYTSRFSWRGQIRDKQGQVSISLTMLKQQLRWNIEPEGEFPIPLAILYDQNDLKKRGLTEGMLRDIVGTPPELIDQRIEGFGFNEETLRFLFAANDRFLTLQLSPGHAELMALEPEFVRQYAREVGRVVSEVTGDQVEMHVRVEESVNSRPFKVILPDTVELMNVADASTLWSSIQPMTEPLPSLELRMEGARRVLAQRELEREMELRTMGLNRPPELLKSPAISDEADKLLDAEFAELLK